MNKVYNSQKGIASGMKEFLLKRIEHTYSILLTL